MKKSNKSIILILLISIIFITTGCSSKELDDNSNFSVGVVLSEGSVKDLSLNQLVISGLESAKRDLGVDGEYIETKKDREYISNIEAFVEEEKDLIIGVGRDSADAMLEAARAYTESKFVLIDYNYEDDNEGIPSNMVCITFRERQIGYLVGLIAGSMTETKKLGFVGQERSSTSVEYEESYVAGIRAINPKLEVVSEYTGENVKNGLAKEIANDMFENNVDIIFCSDPRVVKDVAEEAKLQNKYIIGVNIDQNILAPNNVLTSGIKNIELGMLEIIEKTIEDKFKGGREINYGLKEEGVAIADSTDKNVPKEVIDIVNEAAAKMIEWNYKIIKTN